MTVYWTTFYPDRHPSYDFDIDVIETLSEEEILEQYWPHWISQMFKSGNVQMALSLDAKDHCIEDWCITHWASRNRWREIQDLYT